MGDDHWVVSKTHHGSSHSAAFIFAATTRAGRCGLDLRNGGAACGSASSIGGREEVRGPARGSCSSGTAPAPPRFLRRPPPLSSRSHGEDRLLLFLSAPPDLTVAGLSPSSGGTGRRGAGGETSGGTRPPSPTSGGGIDGGGQIRRRAEQRRRLLRGPGGSCADLTSQVSICAARRSSGCPTVGLATASGRGASAMSLGSSAAVSIGGRRGT
ncbi:unnamed protein product [Urochloa humidicola]